MLRMKETNLFKMGRSTVRRNLVSNIKIFKSKKDLYADTEKVASLAYAQINKFIPINAHKETHRRLIEGEYP